MVVHTAPVAFLSQGVVNACCCLRYAVRVAEWWLPWAVHVACGDGVDVVGIGVRVWPVCSRDKMGVSLFPAEQREYFDLLYHWKKAGAAGRTLALLSGDMHFAMKSVVRK